MFDTSFARLFRAVDRIRTQLETADVEFRQVLAEELACLQRLSDQYIDHWMTLDEQIQELIDTFHLQVDSDTQAAPVPLLASVSEGEPSTFLPWLSEGTVDMGAAPVQPPAEPYAESFVKEPDSDWESAVFMVAGPAAEPMRKGLAYYDLLMYDEATKVLSTAIDVMDHPVARLYLAAAHAARGRHQLAQEHALQVLKQAEHPLVTSAAYELLAHTDAAQGRISDAIVHLYTIARMMPDYQDVWFNIALCHAIEGDAVAAERLFEDVLASDPKDAGAALMLAKLQLRQNRPQAALHTCASFLESGPRHAEVQYLYSVSLATIGKMDEAISACRRLLESNPHHFPAWSALAWMYLRDDKATLAIATLKKLGSFRPDDSSWLVQLGVAYLFAGDAKRAEDMLFQALPLYPDKSILWIGLGRASALQDSPKEAATRYLRAMKDPRKPIKRLAMYYLGCLRHQDGKLTEAERLLKAALLLGPPNAAILTALSETTLGLGRKLEAYKLKSKALAIAVGSHGQSASDNKSQDASR